MHSAARACFNRGSALGRHATLHFRCFWFVGAIGAMASALQGTHSLHCRTMISTWLPALVVNRVRNGANTPPLSTNSIKQQHHVTLDIIATYAETFRDAFNNNSTTTVLSGAATSAQQRRSSSYSRARTHARSSPEICRPCSVVANLSGGRPMDRRANIVESNSRLRSYHNIRRAITISRTGHANSGSFRAFGGQSVVPWELALFLVEEVS